MALSFLIELNRCRKDAGTFLSHAGRELAVFRLDHPKRVFVIDNACPHSSGNLAGGTVEGHIVTCPLHQWAFDLETGVCTESHLAKVRVYPTEVRGGELWIDLDTPATHPAAPTPGRVTNHDAAPRAPENQQPEKPPPR